MTRWLKRSGLAGSVASFFIVASLVCIVYAMLVPHIRVRRSRLNLAWFQSERTEDNTEVDVKHVTQNIENLKRKNCEVMLNILTTFPDSLGNETYLASRGYNDTVENFRKRHNEYLYSLKLNSEHKCVEHIHIFVESTNMKQAIQTQTAFPIEPSLIDEFFTFVKVDGRTTFRMLAEYSAKNLLGRTVSWQNADISLGEGFENLKLEYLKDMRIFYSLSRHGPMNKTSCQLRDYCNNYVGNHDVYLFYFDTPFTHKALMILDHPVNVYGGENVLMYVSREEMRYKVRNPCNLLKIYHNHCSNLRSSKRPPINDKISATSEPVGSLF